MIVKNEEKNLPRLLKSVEGCFDEIVIADTGSTDKTIEIAFEAGCKVFQFEWVDSFCKARNFAFSKATCDFVMWLDADDSLDSKEAFIKWRDHAMEFVDCWFATYHYAVDKDLNPVISFLRERVVRRSLNPQFQYDLHEGIIPQPGWSCNYATPWSVKHLRDAEDMKADRSRNINLLEKLVKAGNIDARMQFYYGKELFEAQRPHDAVAAFDKAILMIGLQQHDKVLTLQYGGYAALACFDQTKTEFVEQRLGYINRALDYAHEGIQLDSHRAEFHVLAGDAHLRAGNLRASIPYFAAAKACFQQGASGPYAPATYSFKPVYGEAPSLQLSKIYTHLGMLDKAKKEAQECIEAYNNEEARGVLSEVNRISMLVEIDNNQTQSEDIVFSCPPQQAYEFDEEIYKTKPLGGSETALVQMARLLKEKTGRNVIIFNQRAEELVADSGVKYVPNSKLATYFSQIKPRVHIAWRHNIKCTNAPTALWCHDLFTPGVESIHNFDKFLALSPFHKNYTMGLQGVPEDKIVITRNGIDPKKFAFEPKPKNPNKVVWLSSPDRGLERCMQVMDEVRKEFPETTLSVYYGIEGLYKYGPAMSALADKLKVMMAERPWVIYHGFVEQNKMYQDVSDAVVWCHPNNFIETFAITALETIANGIFPVVRRLGALQDTLREAEAKGQAMLLDYAWDDPNGIKLHADAVCDALRNKSWEKIVTGGPWFEKHAWSIIADEWIELFGLKQPERAFPQEMQMEASA